MTDEKATNDKAAGKKKAAGEEDAPVNPQDVAREYDPNARVQEEVKVDEKTHRVTWRDQFYDTKEHADAERERCIAQLEADEAAAEAASAPAEPKAKEKEKA